MEDKLFNKKEIGWSKIDTREKEAIYSYCNGYMNFMNKSKTEREAVVTAKAIAESNGFRDLSTYETLQPGDKVYFINREKSMYLAVIGTEKLENEYGAICTCRQKQKYEGWKITDQEYRTNFYTPYAEEVGIGE